MKILSRYVFREILAGSFLATALATFIIFLPHLGSLIELLVRTGDTGAFLRLCVYSLPPVLLLSIPFGVLVGILIGLGRLSGDNEMIAMRSGGISSRIVVAPVLCFAAIALLISGACAVWLNPLAIRASVKLLNKAGASTATADVIPQVFQEQFTNDNTVLFVYDVISGVGPAVWKGVFIADIGPPGERKNGLKDPPVGPKIIIASKAIAVPDPAHNRVQLNMVDESVDDAPVHSHAPTATWTLTQNEQEEKKAKAYQDMFTGELITFVKAQKRGSQDSADSRVELNGRFALPFACVMLALVGIPLGASSRRGGRSAGYVWGIFLSFFVYYLGYITLTGLARSRAMSPELASWLPDAFFGTAGLLLITRMETPGDRDLIGGVRAAFTSFTDAVSRMLSRTGKSSSRRTGGSSRFVLFQLMDSYVLSTFLFYFVLWLAAFVTMTQVYNFFELLKDIVKNHILLTRVATFHLFLTPLLVYNTLPVAVLLAVLVTFGVMTKNNEVTAFKACGISVRRLGLPVLVMSGVLSAAVFAADYRWIPQANRIQDEIHNEIKGRPAQTYLHPERKWVYHDDRIFYIRGFEANEKLMIEPWVFELEPKTHRLIREINANRATWNPGLKQWVWEQGTVRDIVGVDEKHVDFPVMTFAEISEVPDDFLVPVQQTAQMNYVELGNYMKYLSDHGFDTEKLKVQYYKKFAFPVFAFIMALISVPFGFLVGNRGAMAGIGVSIGIAMAYYAIQALFEQMGNVNYLPAQIAAWSPDALFALAGMYLTLRMRS